MNRTELKDFLKQTQIRIERLEEFEKIEVEERKFQTRIVIIYRIKPIPLYPETPTSRIVRNPIFLMIIIPSYSVSSSVIRRFDIVF